MPLKETVEGINKECGWTLITEKGYEYLAKAGVQSLYGLRCLCDEKWQNLPFTPATRKMITSVIDGGKKKTSSLPLQRQIASGGDISSNVCSLKATAPGLSGADVYKSFSHPLNVLEHVDRLKVFSPYYSFDERVMHCSRIHVPDPVDDDTFKEKSALELTDREIEVGNPYSENPEFYYAYLENNRRSSLRMLSSSVKNAECHNKSLDVKKAWSQREKEKTDGDPFDRK